MKFMAYNLGPPPAEKIDNPNPPTPDPGPPPAEKIDNPNPLVLLLSSPHGKAGSAGKEFPADAQRSQSTMFFRKTRAGQRQRLCVQKNTKTGEGRGNEIN